jgi:hypothetical protein
MNFYPGNYQVLQGRSHHHSSAYYHNHHNHSSTSHSCPRKYPAQVHPLSTAPTRHVYLTPFCPTINKSRQSLAFEGLSLVSVALENASSCFSLSAYLSSNRPMEATLRRNRDSSFDHVKPPLALLPRESSPPQSVHQKQRITSNIRSCVH